MPTILKQNEYRFFFYSNELNEPAHIHVTVKTAGCEAKFWIEPNIRLASNYGFKPHQLNEIEKIVDDNQDNFRAKWNEFFST